MGGITMTKGQIRYNDIYISDQLRISITSDCNMLCRYCHNEGTKRMSVSLSYEDVIYIVGIFMQYGFKEIRFTGGEPCIHPDLKRMCQYIRCYYPNILIGINTNGVSDFTIESLIGKKLIDRVVIGMDYYNRDISKDSLIGVPSEYIKNNLLKYKRMFGNKNRYAVCVDSVYMHDWDNTISIIDWCLAHKIYCKIIEEVEVGNDVDAGLGDFEEFVNRIEKRYGIPMKQKENGSLYFEDKNGTRIRFLDSFCRKGKCKECKATDFRITSRGEIIRCLIKDSKKYNIISGDYQNVIKHALKDDGYEEEDFEKNV